jgi:hypothetical protein
VASAVEAESDEAPPVDAASSVPPDVIPLAERSPLAPADRVVTTVGVGTAPHAPEPQLVVVPRRDCWFDVYSTGAPVESVTITASSRRANAIARVTRMAGREPVVVVVDPRAELRGSLALSPDWPASWFAVEVRAADGSVSERANARQRFEAGSFVLTGLPVGPASLAVFVRGDDEPLVVVDGLELRAGEVCRDPRMQRIALPDTLRRIELDVQTPDGRPWSNAADEGIVWFGTAGTARTERLEQAIYLDEGRPTVVLTRRASLDVDVEVPGFRMVELRAIAGDRRVVLEPGIPVRVVGNLPGGDGGEVIVMRRLGDDWEPNQPYRSAPLLSGGHAELRVALPGRYNVLGIGSERVTIDVADRAELQVFRIE